MQQRNITKLEKFGHEKGHTYWPINILVNSRRIASVKSWRLVGWFVCLGFCLFDASKVSNISSGFIYVFIRFYISNTLPETCATSLGFAYAVELGRVLPSSNTVL